MTELEFDLSVFEELLEQSTEQKAAEAFENKFRIMSEGLELDD